jgi:O-antigen ligase
MREIATILCLAGIPFLLRLDRDGRRVSFALWLPVAWTFLAGSRMISEWFGSDYKAESPEALLDGSPLDRLVITAMLAAGLLVLMARGPRVLDLLRANGPVVLFFLWAGFSVLWSDYPDVALKRWIKACGNVVMVLIVLTDADPAAALRRYLARLGFALIPLSILFIKYYPDLGREYHRWTWKVSYTGVATSKNSLGYVCLVLGLAALWRLLETRRWSVDGNDAWMPPGLALRTRRRMLLAHGLLLAMTLWLLRMADSATTLFCFAVAGGLMMAAGTPTFRRTPGALHIAVAAGVIAVLCGLLFADVLTSALGRDTTLTGRTELWDTLLEMSPDPVLGTGFESFWLGPRVARLWQQYWWHPNQAHNGYLETFLNLGAIGVLLLMAVIVRGYRNVVDALVYDPEGGRLKLAYLTASLLYNLTEAAFKGMHLVWIAFFLAVLRLPRWAVSAELAEAPAEAPAEPALEPVAPESTA